MSNPKQIILEECGKEEATHWYKIKVHGVHDPFPIGSIVRADHAGVIEYDRYKPMHLVESTALTEEQALAIAEKCAEKRFPYDNLITGNDFHNQMHRNQVNRRRNDYIKGIMDVLLNNLPQ